MSGRCLEFLYIALDANARHALSCSILVNVKDWRRREDNVLGGSTVFPIIKYCSRIIRAQESF